MENIYEHFNSITQLITTLNAREKNQVMSKCNASIKNDYNFCLTNSYEEAINLLRNGWKEKINFIKLATISKTTNYKKRIISNPVGFIPNVPNAIQNIPNAMFADIGKKPNNFINIFYSISQNAGTAAKDMQNASILMLKAVQILEQQNIRTKLTVSPIAIKGMQQYICCGLTLKNYNEPINLYKMLFPMCHPSFFRRIGFRYLETCPCEIEQFFYYGTYGIPLEAHELQNSLPNKIKKEKLKIFTAKSIIDIIYSNFDEKTQLKKLIEDILK